MVYQNVSISKGSSEIAILVEKVAGQPVSLNLGQPQRASTPPCWVNLVIVVLNVNTAHLYWDIIFIKGKRYCSFQFIANFRD